MAQDKKAKKEELPFHDVSLIAKARKAEKEKEQKEHEEALERFFAAGGKVQYVTEGDGNSDKSTASSVWGRRKKKEPEVKKK